MAEVPAGNPRAPHVAVVAIVQEVYEQTAGGHYSPNRKHKEDFVIALRCSNEAVCRAKLTNFIDEIKRLYEEKYATAESEGEGPGQPPVPGPVGVVTQPVPVLGMRGGFAGRHGG